MAVNSNFIKAKTRGLDLGVGDGIGPLAKAKLVAAKALQSVLPAKVVVHVYYIILYCIVLYCIILYIIYYIIFYDIILYYIILYYIILY